MLIKSHLLLWLLMLPTQTTPFEEDGRVRGRTSPRADIGKGIIIRALRLIEIKQVPTKILIKLLSKRLNEFENMTILNLKDGLI